ncbi:imidazole glycerol phosphate synthase subunit HisH [Tuberibacillus calidus]|jgi:glutamine amidotransferase|uniref:imidazole glycerol phosphate synthase subunit HisH n=1 Tax=Tuberibacillus calidus TaxID=340097 RepID=UPI0003F7BA4D|nr:imidazole glycerol phosphate synthase subunit HisH [Tuberibacillus calidus]
MIGIVDYGMGNVASLSNALRFLGYEPVVTDQSDVLGRASHIILPGVGSFKAAVDEMDQRGLRSVLKALVQEKPLLGICLGMQLLFTTGTEGGISKGLDILPGTVEKLPTHLCLPHIGWNPLDVVQDDAAFRPFQGKAVYFVHSYGVNTNAEYIVATAEYGLPVPAIVRKGKVFGMQFHPEKSGPVGLAMLKIFLGNEAKA